MLLSKFNQTIPSSNIKTTWSNREFALITKYKQRIKDIEQINLQKLIINKQVNELDFYKIASKEDLPKYLQKMKFQTLHSKQNVGKVIKIWKKQKQTQDEKNIRRKLKQNGNIMYLSQIYQNLGEANEFKRIPSTQMNKQMQNFGDLQQWQKNKNTAASKLLIIRKSHQSPRYKQSRIIDQKLSQLQRRGTKGNINFFKQGSNYKREIQKQLDIIYFTHSNQPKQINRYTLIQNSSKLLKKQLDQRRQQVEQSIKSKLKILNETRIQHHNLYEQKSCLLQQQRQIIQEMNSKQIYMLNLSSNLQFNNSNINGTNSRYDKSTDIRAQKKIQIEQNQIKIIKNKRLIQTLQNAIQSSEEQLRSIMVGEVCFYKTSLKIGMDCRDNGLGWILKKLRQLSGNQNKQNNNNSQAYTNNNHKQYQYQFPTYLDKKSKDFLIIKTQWEDQLDNLMEQKRKFVNQIGQSSSGCNTTFQVSKQSRILKNTTSGMGCYTPTNLDKIMQDDVNCADIPKKYRRSLRKITMLNQQYAQNQSLIEFKKRPVGKAVELSSQIQSLSGKKLYETIGEKIKNFDFTSKSKKDKLLSAKNNKLLEYQSLLNSIKEIHIKIEDLDISHENHLVNHYKDNREVFFEQAAACFGYKKAYSMIIKHFSWKTGKQQTVQI